MQTWVAGLVTCAITILELFSLDEPPQGILTEKNKRKTLIEITIHLNRIQFNDKGINFYEKKCGVSLGSFLGHVSIVLTACWVWVRA